MFVVGLSVRLDMCVRNSCSSVQRLTEVLNLLRFSQENLSMAYDSVFLPVCLMLIWPSMTECSQATYCCCRTERHEITRTRASLICSCVASRGWEGAIREGRERGCHVELKANSTTPQRKITRGTNGKPVRLCASLFLLLGSYFCITHSLSIILISQSFLFT